MSKINLNERLSKKTTVVIVVCLLLFVVAAFVGAIVGHKTYLRSCEAKILNASSSPTDGLFMRADGLTFAYRYDAETEEVSLNNVLVLSKGASFTVKTVLDEKGSIIPSTGNVFNVKNGETYYVFIFVTSKGGMNVNGYVLEIVSSDNYTDKLPDFIDDYKSFPSEVRITAE